MSGINESNTALKYGGQDNKIAAAAFRCAVIASVVGITIPDDVKVKSLDPKEVSRIKNYPSSEAAERLLFLYGAGVIDADILSKLIIFNKGDFLEDVLDAENRVKADNEKSAEERLPYGVIQEMLFCAATSKKYAEIQSISFSDAAVIAGLRCLKIVDGTVKVRDREFLAKLLELGEKFGSLDDHDEVRTTDIPENILNSEDVKNGKIESKYYPFSLDPKRLIYYSKIWDKAYGKDFIEYAKNNSIPADDSFERRYGEYLNKVKLHFKARSYKRKRHICGNKINWFDYAAYSDGDIKDELKPDFEKEFDLTVDLNESYTDEILEQKAINDFTNSRQLENNTVIELYHGKEIKLFIMKKATAVPLDVERFHTLLFDFNNIWSIIQECSRKHEIKMMNGKIVIPENMYAAIKPEEREFADNLIREQYMRMIENRKNNAIIQTLSEITNQAAEDRKKIDGANSAREAAQQEIADKMAHRQPSTENTGGKKQ